MTHTFGDDNLSWIVVDDHHLEKAFEFPDFAKALEFVNLAGQICEDQDHHAEFILSWGKVVIKTWSQMLGITEVTTNLQMQLMRWRAMDPKGREIPGYRMHLFVDTLDHKVP